MIQEGLGQTAVWWAAYLHQVQVGVGAEELIIDAVDLLDDFMPMSFKRGSFGFF